ncbi:Hypothetical protein SCF082_LOCUS2443 [Durusdinium trenchii]|uniref:Transmembrane protein n=1 Tax=Durusdinium trenchii TaxID=1381693 RepID=A0ABP0HN11_9DINO
MGNTTDPPQHARSNAEGAHAAPPQSGEQPPAPGRQEESLLRRRRLSGADATRAGAREDIPDNQSAGTPSTGMAQSKAELASPASAKSENSVVEDVDRTGEEEKGSVGGPPRSRCSRWRAFVVGKSKWIWANTQAFLRDGVVGRQWLIEPSSFPASARYWEVRDSDKIGEKGMLAQTRTQLWLGGSSNILLEVRSRLLMLFMLTYFFVLGLRVYTDVFAVVLDELNRVLEDVDDSGTLSALLSTLCLIAGMFFYALVWTPAFIFNNARAPRTATVFSFLYYCAVAGAGNWYIFASFVDPLDAVPDEVGTFMGGTAAVINSLGFIVGLYVVGLSFTTGKSYFMDRLEAFRLYTFWRTRRLSRMILRLSPRTQDDSDTLNRNYSHVGLESIFTTGLDYKRRLVGTTGMAGKLKFAWVPKSDLLKVANFCLEVPILIQVCTVIAVVLVIVIGVEIPTAAMEARKAAWDRAEEFDDAAAVIDPDNKLNREVIEFLESRAAWWRELANPLYQSLMGAGYLGLIWTFSFIPSASLGYLRYAVEIRLGLCDAPGMLSNAREDEIMAFRGAFYMACVVSCVIFAFLLCSFVFFLVMMLFTYPPFWDFVWSLNWLWLPSIILMLFNQCLNRALFERNFLSRSFGANKSSSTLVRPHAWSFVEMQFSVAYIPAYAWAAFMRCIYVLLVALLGLMRVDTTLMPSGAHTFDSPYLLFMSLLLRSEPSSNPLILVAVEVFRSHLCSDVLETTTPGLRRARNRFWLALTLHRFPALRRFRVHEKAPPLPSDQLLLFANSTVILKEEEDDDEPDHLAETDVPALDTAAEHQTVKSVTMMGESSLLGLV